MREAQAVPRRSTPRLAADTIGLIKRMALNNVTWGSERIRGELRKLGIRVSKRTISGDWSAGA
jgi:hypothetical protein